MSDKEGNAALAEKMLGWVAFDGRLRKLHFRSAVLASMICRNADRETWHDLAGEIARLSEWVVTDHVCDTIGKAGDQLFLMAGRASTGKVPQVPDGWRLAYIGKRFDFDSEKWIEVMGCEREAPEEVTG